MASTSFRDSVNALGWSRREGDTLANTNSTPFFSRLHSLNPFGQGDGYLQLPTHEAPGAPLPAPSRREEEDTFFALSRWDRMLIFSACNLGAAVCFVICFFPVSGALAEAPQICYPVVRGIFTFLAIMGCPHGTHDLRQTSDLGITAALYGRIFRVHRHDSVFCYRASQHLPHPPLVHLSARRSTMVHCQLFPHGQHRAAVYGSLWRSTRYGVDQ